MAISLQARRESCVHADTAVRSATVPDRLPSTEQRHRRQNSWRHLHVHHRLAGINNNSTGLFAVFSHQDELIRDCLSEQHGNYNMLLTAAMIHAAPVPLGSSNGHANNKLPIQETFSVAYNSAYTMCYPNSDSTVYNARTTICRSCLNETFRYE